MIGVRHLGRSAALYAIGTFTQRAASLLLVPLYTAVLAVPEYGALETLTTIIQTLSIVINFGLSNALLRFYSECKDADEVDLAVRTSSALVLGISAALAVFVLPLSPHLGSALFKEESYGTFIVLAFIWAIGSALNQQLFAYYRARQNAGIYVVFSLGMFLLLVFLNVLLVRFASLGLLGVLLGNIATTWLVNLWLLARFWRRSRAVSRYWSAKLLAFGSPLVLSMLGWLVLNSADRYFLAYHRSLAEVALYGLGYKVGLIVQMAVVTPFQLAWGPYMFARFGVGARRGTEDSARIFTYLLLVYSILSMGIFLFSPEIVHIFGGGRYAEAVRVVPFVLAAYLFNAIYYWAASVFHLLKRTLSLSLIVASMALLSLLLNELLVPQMGWTGAAVATVVTIGGTGLVSLLVAQYLLRIPLEGIRLLKLAGAVAATLTLYALAPVPAGIAGWAVRAGTGFLLLALLWLFRFADSREVAFLTTAPGMLWRRLSVEGK